LKFLNHFDAEVLLCRNGFFLEALFFKGVSLYNSSKATTTTFFGGLQTKMSAYFF
jgi:hypothetical protein